MTKTQEIPADVMAEARRVWSALGFVNDRLNQVPVLASALLARDTAARKECAEIARQKFITRVDADGKIAFAAGSEIATAIEATITGGGDEQR